MDLRGRETKKTYFWSVCCFIKSAVPLLILHQMMLLPTLQEMELPLRWIAYMHTVLILHFFSYEPAFISLNVYIWTVFLDFQAAGDAAGEDVESDSDSDDDDDDVRVTIGDIKTGAPQYT